jgi:predicted DsbA family dithiol-disulfide isomerase
MNALVLAKSATPRHIDIDLVADFTCPWSWLGLVQLDRALTHLQGDVRPRLRWHPFRLTRNDSAATEAVEPRSFRDYLAQRLPNGITAEFAERSLADVGRSLGIQFHFDKLESVPDTARAHRLTLLADREGKQAEVAAAIFRAYFETGADIGRSDVLQAIAERCGLSPSLVAEFVANDRDDPTLEREEARLRSFGVQSVPNLLFDRRVLVPGAVDVNTYVTALDETLFPAVEPDSPRTLH